MIDRVGATPRLSKRAVRAGDRGIRRLIPFALVLGLLGGAGASAGEVPAAIDGLVAWYRVDSLHRNHNNGDFVTAWPDSADGGHHLTADAGGVKAQFETRSLNGEPAVRVRGRTVFHVEQPFELADHTIFLVLACRSARRGLFYDDADDRNGLILFDEGGYHRYHSGDPERLTPYNEKPLPGREFSITVLKRSQGILGCLFNGTDCASRLRFTEPLRIGGFFFARGARNARLDGDGLQIAEMIFYDRGLSGAETTEVTAYLSGKYGIAVKGPESERAPAVPPPPPPFLPPREEAGAWLATAVELDVNAGAVVLPWDEQLELQPPFEHEPDRNNSRLHCTRDGTSVELFVQLPVKTSARGTAVRLLILKNGTEYLEPQSDSGTITGRNPKRATLRLRATLQLQAGDFFEVVASASGGPGVVVIEPAGAALVVRVD